MKNRRLISFLCAIAMSLTLVLPVSAANSIVEYDEFANYEQITVFSAATEHAPQTFNAVSQDNFQLAREAVLNLNLEEQGFSYIESACLAELDELALDSNCILNEYTVLVPKNRAATPSFYTTYRGVDFYTSVTSKSNVTIERLRFGTYEKLAKWASAGVSLALAFSGADVASYGWSLITADLPISNYTVHTSDWTDCYININPTNRALYVKDGSTYKNVANREYGLTRPYNVYHYNNAAVPSGAVTTNFPSKTYPDVTTSTRDDLLYTAYQVHVSGAVAVNFLLKNVVSFRWK